MVIICFFDFISLKIILIHSFCHIFFTFSISQHQSLNQNPVIAFCNSHCPSQVGNPLHSIFLPNSIPDVFPWESVHLPHSDCWPPCCFSSKNQPKPSDPPPARGHWPSLGVVKNDISNNNPLVNNMLYVLHNVWYLDSGYALKPPASEVSNPPPPIAPLAQPLLHPTKTHFLEPPPTSSGPHHTLSPNSQEGNTKWNNLNWQTLSHSTLC